MEPDIVNRNSMLWQAEARDPYVRTGNILVLQFYFIMCLACATIVLLVTGLVATIGYCVSTAAAVLGGIFGAAIGMICALVFFLRASIDFNVHLHSSTSALNMAGWLQRIGNGAWAS